MNKIIPTKKIVNILNDINNKISEIMQQCKIYNDILIPIGESCKEMEVYISKINDFTHVSDTEFTDLYSNVCSLQMNIAMGRKRNTLKMLGILEDNVGFMIIYICNTEARKAHDIEFIEELNK